MYKKIASGVLILVWLISACAALNPAADSETAQTGDATPNQQQPANADSQTENFEGEGTPEAMPTITPLPPESLRFVFTAEDGTRLEGSYWAPAYSNAPMVVLMHQYPLDHYQQWVAIAPWLQNRGLAASVPDGGAPWSDPSWFSPLRADVSFGVFAFTFRNCQGGCEAGSMENHDEWIKDAVAGIVVASNFTAIDPTQVYVVGTSIGADAAVNACERLLESGVLSCKGVVSISPNSYLGREYRASVERLDAAGVGVYCVAAEQDGTTAETCGSYEGRNYLAVIKPGREHGVDMFDPALAFDLTSLLADWLMIWTMIL